MIFFINFTHLYETKKLDYMNSVYKKTKLNYCTYNIAEQKRINPIIFKHRTQQRSYVGLDGQYLRKSCMKGNVPVGGK